MALCSKRIVMIFNNNHTNLSAVIEIITPINESGRYDIEDGIAFGPVGPYWIYTGDFHTEMQGGAFRLPNGNTLINWGTISDRGALITEVTYSLDTVFEIQYPNEHKVYKARKSDWMFSVNLENGDTDLNNVVDIFDINKIIDHTYQEEITQSLYHKYRFDSDKNGEINLEDVNYIVDLLMNN